MSLHRVGGFDPDAFEGLGSAEASSFWFRSRNALITWAIRRYAREPADILEVGCGTGYVLQAIARDWPSTRLVGVELFEEGLAVARGRLPEVDLRQGDILQLQFDAEFDVVGAFDVLEHVEDDRTALARVAAALRPGGLLVATVPQHPRLWSSQDEAAMHARRYVAADLRTKVAESGFEVVRLTSFVTLLLPALVVGRLRGRFGLRLPGPIDRAFAIVMAAERFLIRSGLELPVGGSLMLVARRTSPPASEDESDPLHSVRQP